MIDGGLKARAESVFEEIIAESLETDTPPDVENACRDQPELASCLRRRADQYEKAIQAFEALPKVGRDQDTSPSSAEGWVGKRIGDFEIVRELGRGGMGIVFLAQQISLRRMVALKVLSPQLAAVPQYVERFSREATATASLSHPGIVSVHAAAETDGYLYIASEYVEGPTLEEVISAIRSGGGGTAAIDIVHALLKRKEMPKKDGDRKSTPSLGRGYIQFAAKTMGRVLDALAHAHNHGIIHRDIKPSNVILRPDGNPVVLDFGLARMSAEARVTMSGELLGTPSYMAPEQVDRKYGAIDQRTDIYSAGVSLYELLLLETPFQEKTPHGIISDILHRDPIAPAKRNRLVPHDLDIIIMHAMEKQPGKRYQAAEEMAADLRRFLKRESIKARPPSILTKLSRRIQRSPYVAASVLLLCCLIAVTSWAVYLATSGTERPYAAEGAAQSVTEVHSEGTAESARQPPPVPAPIASPLDKKSPTEVASDERVVNAMRDALQRENPDYKRTGRFATREGKIVTAILIKSKISNLSPLQGTPLEELHCQRNYISDLSPLSRMKLEKLHIGQNSITDLSPLRGMPLTWLYCGWNRELKDLSPLRGAPLTYLFCHCTKISDLSPLKGMPLQVLDCRGTRVRDLSPLAGMPLESLECSHTFVTDLTPLEGMPLKGLGLAGLAIDDFSVLMDLPLDKLAVSPRLVGGELQILRKHKTLKYIGADCLYGDVRTTADVFWKRWEETQGIK